PESEKRLSSPIEIPYCKRKVQQCPAKSTEITRNVLLGLGLLQLLPTLLQRDGELSPSLQVLLEGAIRGALPLKGGQFLLLDIGQLGTTLLGTRQVVGRTGSGRASGAQVTFDDRTGAQGLRLHQLGLQ